MFYRQGRRVRAGVVHRSNAMIPGGNELESCQNTSQGAVTTGILLSFFIGQRSRVGDSLWLDGGLGCCACGFLWAKARSATHKHTVSTEHALLPLHWAMRAATLELLDCPVTILLSAGLCYCTLLLFVSFVCLFPLFPRLVFSQMSIIAQC